MLIDHDRYFISLDLPFSVLLCAFFARMSVKHVFLNPDSKWA